jgi:hypothetical protein
MPSHAGQKLFNHLNPALESFASCKLAPPSALRFDPRFRRLIQLRVDPSPWKNPFD